MARRTSAHPMSDFRENWELSGPSPTISLPWVPVSTLDVDFFVPDNQESVASVMATCLREASADVGLPQRCSYYLSALCCISTDLVPMAKTVINLIGGKANQVSLPSQSEENLIDMADGVEPAKCLVWWGQLLLLLFKNIDENSYNNFIGKRIKAMRSIVGLPVPELTPAMAEAERASGVAGDMCFDRPSASLFRAAIGAHNVFRKEVLQRILYYSRLQSQIGYLCGYIGGILAWTDMSAMTFIFDVLCSPNSPVLADPRVMNEVNNLQDAFMAVNAFPHPQYFRIMGKPMEVKLLERSRFPTLIAVAQKYRAKQYSTISQFETTMSTEGESLANTLLSVHEAYMARLGNRQDRSAVAYLYNVERPALPIRAAPGSTENPQDQHPAE